MKKLILLSCFTSFFVIAFSQTNYSNEDLYSLDKMIMEKINVYRGECGLKPLIWSNKAYKVAKNQATYISLLEQLDHDQKTPVKGAFKIEPDFTKRFSKYGIDTYSDYHVIGENLAWVADTTEDLSESLESIAERTLKSWKNSPPHNKLLLLDLINYASIANTIGKSSKIFLAFNLDDGTEKWAINTGKVFFIAFEAYR